MNDSKEILYLNQESISAILYDKKIIACSYGHSIKENRVVTDNEFKDNNRQRYEVTIFQDEITHLFMVKKDFEENIIVSHSAQPRSGNHLRLLESREFSSLTNAMEFYKKLLGSSKIKDIKTIK